MNLREMQQKKQQEQMTEISKNTTQKLETPSAEQMMLSKMKELTNALESNKSLLKNERCEKEQYLKMLEMEKKRNQALSSQNAELKKIEEEKEHLERRCRDLDTDIGYKKWCIEDKEKQIRSTEYKLQEALAKVEQSEDKVKNSKRMQTVSYILIWIVLLLESILHRDFWKELLDFFWVPLKSVYNQWLPFLSDTTETQGFLLWLARIGIPLATVSALGFVGFMVILTIKRRCLLTLVITVLSTGIIVIFGDKFTFNRFIPMLVVFVIYHIVYTYNAHKGCSWNNQWDYFRDNLII